MSDAPVRVQRWDCPPGRRILAVSDIHGNLGYFKGLLAKTGFSQEDELVLDGDFLEKGPDSLGTLRYIMALCEKGNVHPVLGNCDGWDHIFDMPAPFLAHTRRYILNKRSGLLWDMCRALGTDPAAEEDFAPCRDALKKEYAAEWAFLASLPHAIETERFIFVHAGMTPGKPLESHSRDELMRCDRFMALGFSFPKWVVVGHYPVMLYGEDRVCANPIIDRDRHIASIDGACVLKDDGQLNALIIPGMDSDELSFTAYDPFPQRTVTRDQAESGRSCYIRWGDSSVQVLERGEEFSRCRHVRTGYEMDILTKYLFSESDITNCNDCTDYALPLKAGDTVSVVEETSRGYFVKHNGYSGWYYGGLI